MEPEYQEDVRKCPGCGKVLEPNHRFKTCKQCFEKWKEKKIAAGQWEERPR